MKRNTSPTRRRRSVPGTEPTPAQRAAIRDADDLAARALELSRAAGLASQYRKSTPAAEYLHAVAFFLMAAGRMYREACEQGHALIAVNGSPNGLDASPELRLVPRPKPAKVIAVDFRARRRIAAGGAS